MMNLVWDHLTEADTGYMDVCGTTHYLKEPLILDDGASVVFPHGWTDEDADKWRKGMRLQRPSDCQLRYTVRISTDGTVAGERFADITVAFDGRLSVFSAWSASA